MNDDINNFVPSLLNPRTVNKENFSLTQNSVVSRCSLSLKRTSGLANRNININQTVPAKKKLFASKNTGNENVPRRKHCAKSICTLPDLESEFERNKENNALTKQLNFLNSSDLDTITTVNNTNFEQNQLNTSKDIANASTINLSSIDLLDWENINIGHRNETQTVSVVKSKQTSLDSSVCEDLLFNTDQFNHIAIENVVCNNSLRSGSSATQLYNCEDTITHDLNESRVSLSFGVQNCDYIDLTTKNTNIKRVLITRKDKDINLDCDIVAETLSTNSEYDENMNLTPPQKRSGVAVSLEIKKKKLAANNSVENPKVLILKTDAIEKLSHVIVQPQNCKLVKRHLSNSKFGNKSSVGVKNDGKSVNLKQISITSFFGKECTQGGNSDVAKGVIVEDVATEMSKNIGVSDLKCVRPYRLDWKVEPSARCRVLSAPRAAGRGRGAGAGAGVGGAGPGSGALPSTPAQHSARSGSPLKDGLSAKTKSNRTFTPRTIPHYKIVAGTHFAVDAFSYGDIPNVKHYFLTHFHSDHYSGLKKNFCKLLYCSKITGDLCVSRLGVNPKCIHVLNLEETTRIEGVEVTAVDANHCPGAVMLFFCLPNGKTILHTGDFRASPAMESYPVFWNSDVHTIYLDTTYCSPRYDFPTQEQSLEQALALLRAKKSALEKAGRKFSSVLIVCGTYTIGKEKFFLGMARRVGCSVWACPEKDKVLQAVEGRSFSTSAPGSCQLHAVPMRDLTHEKLKSYLDSLGGAFSEVVAFKPSGWENGKSAPVERDQVTIHGIPYSEHSSFSELIRFVKFLKPKQVIPTVDISGGIKAVQKYFPCPLVQQEDGQSQSKVTDYFSIESRQQVPAVT